MVYKEKNENFITVHNIDEAKKVLLSAFDFTGRVAITLKRHYDQKNGEKPSSAYEAFGAGLFYHAIDTIKGKNPDYQKISNELTLKQIPLNFNPLTYFNSKVLPPSILSTIQNFLQNNAPFIVVVSDDYVNSVTTNKTTLAYTLENSNLILVRQSDYEKLSTPSQKANFDLLIAHEITHFAARAFQRSELPWWFNEGATEYITRLAIKSEIPQTNLTYYSQFTRLSYYLAELVGKDTFIEAYFTGNLDNIRKKLDELGGFGTFNSFMNEKNKKFDILLAICKTQNLPIEKFEEELKKWGKNKES